MWATFATIIIKSTNIDNFYGVKQYISSKKQKLIYHLAKTEFYAKLRFERTVNEKM